MNALVYEMICDSCLAKWMKEQLKTGVAKTGSRVKGKGQEQGSRVRVKGKGHG